MEDYSDWGVLPTQADLDEYLDGDEIINLENYQKGNTDLCVWNNEPEPAIITMEYIERELRRILRTGVWICIKEEICWIPPHYYFFLKYFKPLGEPMQFRLKRLKHVYQKMRVRNNAQRIGTYTIKNRQDGETTFVMCECLWEAAEGNMDRGSIGMQSKTGDTVQLSCWRTLTMGWNSIPIWLKRELFPDFTSGSAIAEKMKFMREAKGSDMGRDILIMWGNSVFNAFDSMNNMRKCVLDEVNKWKLASLMKTFINYEKFIAAGTSRKGLFDLFSSPSDENGKHNDEAKKLWDDSKVRADGSTASRLEAIVSNPLDGIEGMYDQFGDADPDAIKDFIVKRRREKKGTEFEMEEIRAYPLTEEEMFGSFDGGGVWDNAEGMKERKIFLLNRVYKNPKTKEPVKVFGNLEREDGYVDGDVFFRQADVDHFDVAKARFCFSYLPKPEHKEPLRNIFMPPRVVQSVLGVDPYNLRHDPKDGKKKSLGGAVNYQFLDLYNTGISKTMTMIYLNRPHHQDIFHEDMLRAAIFNRSLVQVESRSDKLANYFEDRGYERWLLTEIGAGKDSKRKGDAPSSSGRFLDEGAALLNAYMSLPAHAGDPYLLENVWFEEVLDDMLNNFNMKDTHKADLTMAFMQAMLGAIKILHKKHRKPSSLTGGILDYLLSD
jgi:hypothetical protein